MRTACVQTPPFQKKWSGGASWISWASVGLGLVMRLSIFAHSKTWNITMSSMPQMLLNYISPYHILNLALGTSLISSQNVQITKDILTQWGGVNFRAIKNIMRTRRTWRERNDHFQIKHVTMVPMCGKHADWWPPLHIQWINRKGTILRTYRVSTHSMIWGK